jgi:SAM-dependent methyltransferase
MSVNNQQRISLKHLCTETHLEAQFSELINRIPKHASQHAEQARHIQELVAAKSWTVKRILDIGAGEGKFTRLVIDLLKESNACPGPLHVDVIEKDDTLYEQCRLLLEGIGATCRRVPTGQNGQTFELAKDREDLLIFADHWKDTLSKEGLEPGYDLLIASHVTYYFDNAGTDLAYAFGSRLLKKSGHAWFVIRDRDCPFYRCRDEFLAASGLPDIHRDCFSDSFLDRLRCMVRDLDKAIPTIFTQPRSLALDVTGNATDLVSYLMWLDGLSSNQIRAAAEAGGRADGFAETHIWVSPITPIRDRESHILAEIDIIGRCIDILRRAAPDVQTHRVFLATVQPTDFTPKADPRAAADIEMPRPFKHFALWSVGYACKPEHESESDLLNSFFETNTSFLFYPRFYLDYCMKHSDHESGWTDYSPIVRLAGEPKHKSPTDYPERTIEVGERKVFPLPSANPDSPSAVNIGPFGESHVDWVKAQTDRYCNQKELQPSSSSLWSICVACNILPDYRHVMSNDQILNACCAVFLTVSTGADLKELAPRFVGQIKARLAQWIAEALYERLQEQMDELNKKAQMLELMQRPLRRISDALSTMQSDTQELRALMFDPEESLFASFSNIAQFFVEATPLPILLEGQERIYIHHSPDKYSHKELPIVLACVLCAVFGELKQLEQQRRANLVLAVAAGVMDDVSENSAKRELVDNLKWLVGLRDGSGNPDPRRSLASLLSEAQYDVQKTALTNIKQALFSPFKTGASTWDPMALQLLARHAKLGSHVLNETLRGSKLLQLPTSPISYASVLAFVRDVAVALTTTQRRVTSLAWAESATVNECVTTFSQKIPPYGQNGINREYLAEILQIVSTCPREWRIQDANYGDTTRPFVRLVNKILGLGGHDRAQWATDKLAQDEVFAIRQPNDQGARFSICCRADSIVLRWE